jgi:anti-sigma regulatory factor (Ser/Thr protein kinase)/DNA-binding XRE family transcriptional regulator
VPDPNLAGISRRSRSSIRPARYWIKTVDGYRLREARIERGLSIGKLAAEAGLSVWTIARLEGGPKVSCHRATLYRIAATLADDPESMFSALVAADDVPGAIGRLVPASKPAASWICSRVFAARPDQVGQARAFLGRVLHGCPMIYEVKVVCSELFTNSLRHSQSALPGGKVTIRAEVREHEYTWLEVEDQGGDWVDGSRGDEGGRGLEVVAALSDYWDIRTREARRTVCARLDWPEHQRSGGL